MTQITAVCDWVTVERQSRMESASFSNYLQRGRNPNQQEIEMQKRQLGNSDLQITRSGMERGRLEARAGNLPGARKAITTPRSNSSRSRTGSELDRHGGCVRWGIRKK